MNHKNFYITTTLPYVNADPHIGFALEIIQADVLSRFHSMIGDNVVFNTGTDEHGLKIFRKAQENNIDPKAYCDSYAAKFNDLKNALNLSYTNFIRTTDEHHKKAAQEFWLKCLENGDIYKKNYQVKYCVGCELEKTDSELVDDKCPIHPNLQLEIIDEENYFFRFGKYQQPLLDFYEKTENFVVPENRYLEIKNFVKAGLVDFSISRLKKKMPWGVEVPNDSDQVMYVWFDALINYISTIGWPTDMEKFNANWPGVQVAGKDNLRQQSAMWQAMLMSAGLPNSKQVFIHGFITAEGQKMSKSLGNVVNPYDIVNKYGTDAVRYYLLGALPSYEDGDFSASRFEEYYTAHLVNGIGNLTSRILTMIEKYGNNKIPKQSKEIFDLQEFWSNYQKYLESYSFDLLIGNINHLVASCDQIISQEKPWEKAKKGEDTSALLYQLAETLRHIGLALLSVIPTSAEKILSQLNYDYKTDSSFEEKIKWGGIKENTEIKKDGILFGRLNEVKK